MCQMNPLPEEVPMCESNPECSKPENLKGRPEDCTPEQIRECHGEDAGHPCSGKD